MVHQPGAESSRGSRGGSGLFAEPVVQFGGGVGCFPGVVADMLEGGEADFGAADFLNGFDHCSGA